MKNNNALYGGHVLNENDRHLQIKNAEVDIIQLDSIVTSANRGLLIKIFM